MPRKTVVLDTNVTAERGTTLDGSELYVVKLQTPAFELNVCVKPDEVLKFNGVRSARWINGALRIGEAAGAPVFWCVDDENDQSVSVLIGHDDQTWDVALTLPVSAIEGIRRELAACGPGR